MAPPTFDYFFDLPPELRELIISYLCLFPSGILVGCGCEGQSVPRRTGAGPVTSSTTSSSSSTLRVTGPAVTASGNDGEDGEEGEEEEEETADPPLDLFLASPVLYREAGDLYYGRNVFYFDFAPVVWGRRQQGRNQQQRSGDFDGSGSGYGSVGDDTETGRDRRNRVSRQREGGDQAAAVMRLISHPDTAGARQRIRHAVVSLRRFGGLVTDVLVPRLGDMVLNGALRRLRVDLAHGFPFGTAGRESGKSWPVYLENPALRALLVLLADPDLEGAELRVSRRFAAKFHHLTRRAMPQAVVQGRKEDDGFVEVDLQGLMNACAGDTAEFRIKKVA